VFFCEFGDTAFVVRRPRGQTSQIVGYLLGIGRRLYERFMVAAAERGATALRPSRARRTRGRSRFTAGWASPR
jgi:hypothetical protein